MKFALITIGANAASIIAIGAAAYLAAHGSEGWGLFLLIALLLAKTVSFSQDETEDTETSEDEK